MCKFSFRALIMPVQKENIVFSSIIVSLWQDILVHVLCNYCLRDDGFPVHGHVLHLLLGCFSRCLWMRLKSILYPYIIWTKSWCKKKRDKHTHWSQGHRSEPMFWMHLRTRGRLRPWKEQMSFTYVTHPSIMESSVTQECKYTPSYKDWPEMDIFGTIS